MRMMLRVTFPTDRFNEMTKAGTVGPTIQKILADTQPEAMYFGPGSSAAWSAATAASG